MTLLESSFLSFPLCSSALDQANNVAIQSWSEPTKNTIPLYRKKRKNTFEWVLCPNPTLDLIEFSATKQQQHITMPKEHWILVTIQSQPYFILSWFACQLIHVEVWVCESAVINPIDLGHKCTKTTMTTDCFVCAGFNKRASEWDWVSEYEWIAHHVHVSRSLPLRLILQPSFPSLPLWSCSFALAFFSAPPSPPFPCFIWLFHPLVPTHALALTRLSRPLSVSVSLSRLVLPWTQKNK